MKACAGKWQNKNGLKGTEKKRLVLHTVNKNIGAIACEGNIYDFLRKELQKV
jgi:hypothetical protein